MRRNLDYPMPMHGRMLRQRLWEARLDAGMLYDVLRDDDAVPAWTLDKIATATNNIGQVSRYLRYKVEKPIQWGAVPEPEKDAEMPTAFKVALGVAGAVMLLDLLAASSSEPKRR